MNLTKAELFPFEYVGGGYFREKGIDKGKSAKMLHGMEAIDFVLNQIKNEERDNDQDES